MNPNCATCGLNFDSLQQWNEHSWSLQHHLKLEQMKDEFGPVQHVCSLCHEFCEDVKMYGRHLFQERHIQAYSRFKQLNRMKHTTRPLTPANNNRPIHEQGHNYYNQPYSDRRYGDRSFAYDYIDESWHDQRPDEVQHFAPGMPPQVEVEKHPVQRNYEERNFDQNGRRTCPALMNIAVSEHPKRFSKPAQWQKQRGYHSWHKATLKPVANSNKTPDKVTEKKQKSSDEGDREDLKELSDKTGSIIDRVLITSAGEDILDKADKVRDELKAKRHKIETMKNKAKAKKLTDKAEQLDKRIAQISEESRANIKNVLSNTPAKKDNKAAGKSDKDSVKNDSKLESSKHKEARSSSSKCSSKQKIDNTNPGRRACSNDIPTPRRPSTSSPASNKPRPQVMTPPPASRRQRTLTTSSADSDPSEAEMPLQTATRIDRLTAEPRSRKDRYLIDALVKNNNQGRSRMRLLESRPTPVEPNGTHEAIDKSPTIESVPVLSPEIMEDINRIVQVEEDLMAEDALLQTPQRTSTPTVLEKEHPEVPGEALDNWNPNPTLEACLDPGNYHDDHLQTDLTPCPIIIKPVEGHVTFEASSHVDGDEEILPDCSAVVPIKLETADCVIIEPTDKPAVAEESSSKLASPRSSDSSAEKRRRNLSPLVVDLESDDAVFKKPRSESCSDNSSSTCAEELMSSVLEISLKEESVRRKLDMQNAAICRLEQLLEDTKKQLERRKEVCKNLLKKEARLRTRRMSLLQNASSKPQGATDDSSSNSTLSANQINLDCVCSLELADVSDDATDTVGLGSSGVGSGTTTESGSANTTVLNAVRNAVKDTFASSSDVTSTTGRNSPLASTRNSSGSTTSSAAALEKNKKRKRKRSKVKNGQPTASSSESDVAKVTSSMTSSSSPERRKGSKRREPSLEKQLLKRYLHLDSSSDVTLSEIDRGASGVL